MKPVLAQRGQAVQRVEDQRLLRGQGRFVDNLNISDQTYLYVVRSYLGHAKIQRINTESISKMSGVLAVFVGEDYYDEVSMVTKIYSFLELNEKIKYALNNYKFNNKEMNVLIQSFENQTISVPYFSILKNGIVISSIQRIENDFNLTIKNFEKYFETHKQYFQVIANEVYSKI